MGGEEIKEESMAKKEVNTDLWVHELLKEAGIRDKFDAQGSNIKELNDALKTASKKGTGKSGFPEYVGIVKDFLIVIEDKSILFRIKSPKTDFFKGKT